MTLRDLSFWTLVKLSLFFTALIPLVAIICLVPLVLLEVNGVTLSATGEGLPKLLGIMSFEFEGPPLWITSFVIYSINLLFSCKLLQLIARFTPIGNIRVGNRNEAFD